MWLYSISFKNTDNFGKTLQSHVADPGLDVRIVLKEFPSQFDVTNNFFLIFAVGLWVLRPLQAYCTSPG
jgi:hypothetical protein